MNINQIGGAKSVPYNNQPTNFQKQGNISVQDKVSIGGSKEDTPVDFSKVARKVLGKTEDTSSIIWEKNISHVPSYQPVIDRKNRIFFADSDGNICAIKSSDGTFLWKKEARLTAPPVIAKNGKVILLFHAAGGRTNLLDPSTGAHTWRNDININGVINSITSSPDGSVGYFKISSYPSSKIMAVDLKKGNVQWEKEFEGLYGLSGDMMVTKDRIYVNYRGRYVVLNAKDGKEIQKISAFSKLKHSPVLSANGKELYGVEGGEFIAVDPKDGKKLWSIKDQRFGEGSPYRTPVVASDSMVIVYTPNNSIYGVNTKTKKVIWNLEGDVASDGYVYPPTIDENKGIAYFVKDDEIKALDLESGKMLWKVKEEGVQFTSPPVLKKGALFVSGKGGIIGIKDGEKFWENKTTGKAKYSPLLDPIDDKVYLINILSSFGSRAYCLKHTPIKREDITDEPENTPTNIVKDEKYVSIGRVKLKRRNYTK